jgi:hypothetical protein
MAASRCYLSVNCELFNIPYEPYAPVRQQLLNLLRLINKARHAAGLDQLPAEVLRYRRLIVKSFGATSNRYLMEFHLPSRVASVELAWDAECL